MLEGNDREKCANCFLREKDSLNRYSAEPSPSSSGQGGLFIADKTFKKKQTTHKGLQTCFQVYLADMLLLKGYLCISSDTFKNQWIAKHFQL